MADGGSLVEDDVLRLVLMCAHPALAPEAASALSLRLVLGVPTADIARLFLVPEPTMAARITRAKKRIVGAGIPFAVPDAGVAARAPRGRGADRLPHLHRRLLPRHRPRPAARRASPARRSGWCASCSACVPDEPALVALLALMLLQHSRRDARVARRSSGAPRRPGPHPVAPRRDRGGDPAARPAAPGRPADPAGGVVRPAGADRRRARHRADAAGHPLGPRRRAVRPAAAGGAHPVGPARASRRRRRGARSGRRPRRARGAGDPRRATGPPRSAPSCCPASGDVDAARAAYDQAIAACRNEVERAFLVAQACRAAGPLVRPHSSGTGCCLARTVRPSSTTKPRAQVVLLVDADLRRPAGRRRSCR